MIILLTPS